MARQKCPLCGRFISQKEEVIRVVVERARKKKKVDSTDATEWSDVITWSPAFVGHAKCTEDEVELRDSLVEIPALYELPAVFDADKNDNKKRPNLTIVKHS